MSVVAMTSLLFDVRGHRPTDLVTRCSEGLVALFQLALSGHCGDSSLMYDLESKAIEKDGPTCFEGERVTPTQGRKLCDPRSVRASFSAF